MENDIRGREERQDGEKDEKTEKKVENRMIISEFHTNIRIIKFYNDRITLQKFKKTFFFGHFCHNWK